jgi:3-oxoacyl-[acyl-carrier-protein] synthase-3
MNLEVEKIGIIATGIYLPEERMTASELAQAANLPIGIVQEKLGIVQKTIPGINDHTCQMGIWAAEKALQKAQINAADIDIIIYIGEEHKEYPLWTAAIKLQESIGAINAWAFDVALRCGTTIMALNLAKSLMKSDDTVRTVLLAGGYRNVDFIDYANPRTRFMYNLAAGGGAIVLKKGAHRHRLLETKLITDGAFSEDVVVPAGGTKQPLSPAVLEQKQNYLDVIDPVSMKERLAENSMANFITVIKSSLEKSGYSVGDIDYVAMLHMKKSAHDYILNELGLTQEQSIYLDHYGHLGQIDQILSLELAEKAGMLKSGDIVVLVSAGIGYAWGATTIIWDEGKVGKHEHSA